MHRSQRTGAVTWRTRRCSISRPWLTAAPSRLDSRIRAGSAGVMPAATAASAASAGAMYGVWNAPATWSADDPGLGRRLGGELVQPVERAGGDDLAGAVAVGRVQPVRLDRGEHLVRVAAEHGGHAGRLQRAGGGHLPAAHAGEGDRRLGAAARRPARRRPARRRCGRRRPATSYIGRCSAASSAAATSSGWVRAVSLISSASAAVPRWTRSTPASADHQRSRASAPVRSSQGVRKPGFWEPWPGESTASTSMTLPDTRGSALCRRRPNRTRSFVGFLQRSAVIVTGL